MVLGGVVAAVWASIMGCGRALCSLAVVSGCGHVSGQNIQVKRVP